MKLICFDLDDTLWDFEPVLARAEAELQDWLLQYYPDFAHANSVAALAARRKQLLQERNDLRHDIGRLRLLSMQQAAEHSGYSTTEAKRLAIAAFKIFMRYRNAVTFYDDVVPVLERLRTDYQLCSLTNGNVDLISTGAADLFHHRLSAHEVGAAKPAPAIFLRACELAGVEPAHSLHVGDDAENDIFAARAVGMKTAWINRKGIDWTHEQRADTEIRDLFELEQALEKSFTDFKKALNKSEVP